MIRTVGLSKQFPNENIIEYGDLTFERGKTYILLGASGCGKSTLLNIIAGVLSPSSGSVFIDDCDLVKMSQKEKDSFRIRNIGYIFQDFKLLDEMTVIDNINLLNLEGIDTSSALSMIKVLGIDAYKNKTISKLSGGQKQRVAIVRALVKHPPIILADEPTGNLNFEIGKQVIEELIKISEGKTLIVVSHDERLTCYFDEVIDINQVTTSRLS